MDTTLALDVKHVACNPETGSTGWKRIHEMTQPSFASSEFGLSVATTWRGSVLAVTGREQWRPFYISLYRNAGRRWLEERGDT